MTKHYDLIAIGGGSGGLSAAERAAEYGAKAAVVEFKKLGGTCVNVGCVPKKVMWFASGIAETIKDSVGYGFDVTTNHFDWGKLVAGRENYIKGINDWYGNYLKDSNIDCCLSWGMPIPVSSMSNRMFVLSSVTSKVIFTYTWPCSVNLMALLIRLSRHWLKRIGSVLIIAGRVLSAKTVNAIPFSLALGWIMDSTELSNCPNEHSILSTSILPASILERSRMSLIKFSND